MKNFIAFALLATATVCLGQVMNLRDPGFPAAFTPPQKANLLFWGNSALQAGANGTTVSNWVDRSGNGNDFTNPVAGQGNGPMLTNIAAISNQNAIQFHPASGSVTNLLTSKNGFLSGSPTGEIFAVMRSGAWPGSAGATEPWFFPPISYSGDISYPNPAATPVALSMQFGLGLSLSPILLTNYSAGQYYSSNWHVMHVQIGSNYCVVRYNGDIIGGMSHMFTGQWTNRYFIGGRFGTASFLNGQFAEMMIYNRLLASTDQEYIYKYFTTKYGIAHTNATDVYTPDQFSGLAYWFKASTITSNNNDALGEWVDQRGRGNWTNPASSTRPLFITSAYNGQPCVRFDGTDDFMQLPASFNFTNNFCVIALGRSTRNAANCYIGDPSSTHQLRDQESSVNRLLAFNGGGAASATFPSPTNTLKMNVWRRIGTAMNNSVNTSNYAVGAVSGTFTLGKLGKQQADTSVIFKGDMCEILVYTNYLNDDSLAKLYYTYFRNTYGMSTNE